MLRRCDVDERLGPLPQRLAFELCDAVLGNHGVDIMSAQGPTVYKAGGPTVITVREGTVIR